MKYLWLALLLHTTAVFAEGGSAGNGGDLIICQRPDGSVTTELLDLFEARFFNEYTPRRLSGSNDPLRLLTQIFSDFSDVMPVRAERFQQSAELFMDRVLWVERDLVDIPDSRHIVLPTGCRLQQLAIQQLVNGVPQYTIDARLWRVMDAANQAALMLHEILYTDALADQHKNSVKTRGVVGFLTSDKFQTVGSRGDKWKETAFGKVAELNAQLNDYHFQSGLTVFVHPESISRLFMDARGGWELKVCGFHLPTGEKVNHCATGGWFTLITDGKTPWSFSSPAVGGQRQAVDGSVFGLPIPVYGHLPRRMIDPAAPFVIKNQQVDIRCIPGQEILYATSNQNGLDQQHWVVNSCKLDPAYQNILVIDGVKYPVSSFEMPKVRYEGLSGMMNFIGTRQGEITFSSEQTIEVFGQKLPVISINKTAIILSKNSEWKFSGSRCAIGPSITLSAKDVNWVSPTFLGPCLMKRPEGTYSITGGEFTADGPKFSGYFQIDRPATLKMNGETFMVAPEGKEVAVTIFDNVFFQGRLHANARLTVWDVDAKRDYRPSKVVGRWLPAGIQLKYNESQNERLGSAFEASGWVDLTAPFELPLITLVKRGDGYALTSKVTMLKVVGEAKILNGRLEYGTLAEESVVPVLKVTGDGYNNTWSAENRKLPEQTFISIDWVHPEGYSWKNIR